MICKLLNCYWRNAKVLGYNCKIQYIAQLKVLLCLTKYLNAKWTAIENFVYNLEKKSVDLLNGAIDEHISMSYLMNNLCLISWTKGYCFLNILIASTHFQLITSGRGGSTRWVDLQHHEIRMGNLGMGEQPAVKGEIQWGRDKNCGTPAIFGSQFRWSPSTSVSSTTRSANSDQNKASITLDRRRAASWCLFALHHTGRPWILDVLADLICASFRLRFQMPSWHELDLYFKPPKMLSPV